MAVHAWVGSGWVAGVWARVAGVWARVAGVWAPAGVENVRRSGGRVQRGRVQRGVLRGWHVVLRPCRSLLRHPHARRRRAGRRTGRRDAKRRRRWCDGSECGCGGEGHAGRWRWRRWQRLWWRRRQSRCSGSSRRSGGRRRSECRRGDWTRRWRRRGRASSRDQLFGWPLRRESIEVRARIDGRWWPRALRRVLL